MLCRRACTSPAFCSLIAYSWMDLAACDTQRPVVSKKRNESTRSKSQISPEWAERHKFSPTDCCPRHVPPIERMNNEHSHHRLLCQGQGLLHWNAAGNEGITVCEDASLWRGSGTKVLSPSNGVIFTLIFQKVSNSSGLNLTSIMLIFNLYVTTFLSQNDSSCDISSCLLHIILGRRTARNASVVSLMLMLLQLVHVFFSL